MSEKLLPVGLRRFAPVVGAVAIGLALFGFLSGIREPRRGERPPPPVVISEGTLEQRPNANRRETLADLKFDRPDVFAVVVRTEAMRQAALADRARNRAFDGAPPTIPHPVETRTTASCLACHAAGLKVGERVASRMSHPPLSNCTQCHVEGHAPGRSLENDFVGLYRAGPGERAGPGAPPTIPHSTWMRQDCLACHGLVTRPGTRTTHPWLTSCTQCHAPSATLDQVRFLGGLP